MITVITSFSTIQYLDRATHRTPDQQILHWLFRRFSPMAPIIGRSHRHLTCPEDHSSTSSVVVPRVDTIVFQYGYVGTFSHPFAIATSRTTSYSLLTLGQSARGGIVAPLLKRNCITALSPRSKAISNGEQVKPGDSSLGLYAFPFISAPASRTAPMIGISPYWMAQQSG